MTGTCKFCGQTMMTDFSDPYIADEVATDECTCEEGREFRNMEQWKLEAKQNIDNLCEDVKKGIVNAMKAIVDSIAAGECKKANIKVNERVSISIILKKDCIDVERSFKEKSVLSAEKM